MAAASGRAVEDQLLLAGERFADRVDGQPPIGQLRRSGAGRFVEYKALGISVRDFLLAGSESFGGVQFSGGFALQTGAQFLP